MIDARVRAIARAGVGDFAIFAETADQMPAFKRLMDTSTDDDLDQLATRQAGFYQYAKIVYVFSSLHLLG